MATQIDHIVITVNDLAAASRDYASAGFNVIPGGEHVGGRSHNALITFEDGAYFEIFAFKNLEADTPPQPHRWWSKLQRREGLVDYALLSDDLVAEGAGLAARGVTTADLLIGGRVRPDGQRLDWRILRSADEDALLPFLIDDQTPRELRVPGGEAATHPAGFTGVAGLIVAVPDLAAAVKNYQPYLGVDGAAATSSIPGGGAAWRFELDRHWIELVEPGDAESAIATIVNTHGGGPVEIVLTGGEGGSLSEELTHGVPIRTGA